MSIPTQQEAQDVTGAAEHKALYALYLLDRLALELPSERSLDAAWSKRLTSLAERARINLVEVIDDLQVSIDFVSLGITRDRWERFEAAGGTADEFLREQIAEATGQEAGR